MKKKTLISEVRQLQKIAGILKETKFYSRDYVEKKYGADKAKEIEANIEDEEDDIPNIWDLYTSLETPEAVDYFIKGFMNEDEMYTSRGTTNLKENTDEIKKHVRDFVKRGFITKITIGEKNWDNLVWQLSKRFKDSISDPGEFFGHELLNMLDDMGVEIDHGVE